MEKKLPKGWVETTLGDIALLKGGKRLPKGKKLITEITNHPYIRVTDFTTTGTINLDTIRYITPDIHAAISNYTISHKDIYISIAGTIGKSGIIPKDIEGANFTENAAKLILPLDLLEQHYIYFFTKSPIFKEQIGISVRAVAMPKLALKRLSTVILPLPSIAEQKRIVQKLDTLFERMDKLEDLLAKIPQLVKDFRQSVLTQAVTGKLTEDFKSKSIISEIKLDRKKWYENQLGIAKKLKNKKPRKIKITVEKDRKSLQKALNKNYDVVFFEEIAARKEHALKAGPFGSSLKKDFYVKKGFKIYGQEQVIKNDHNFGDYYIDEERFRSLQSCEVSEGDILISLVGTIGKVLVLPKNHKKGIINPRLVKLSLHKAVNPYFIKIYLQSSIARKILDRMAHGGTMKIINLTILKNLPIPLPSYEEQTEIVRQVEQLFQIADRLEEKYHALKAKIDVLPQAILAKAFRGELVEQLETDGDARELLEEIRKVREAMKGKKKASRRRKKG